MARMVLLLLITASAAASTNMVLNPNFEDTAKGGSHGPLHWSVSADVFSRSTAVVFPPATASLEYHSTDPTLYKFAAQKVAGVVVGREYGFSAAIKTEGLNVSATPGDATVCVQWDGADGKWLGGNYPHGPGGENVDWTTVSGSFTLPSGADPASVTISVYVRPIAIHEPTPTGTAYFDNVSMWFAPRPPLSSVLLSPVYRGRVTAADPTPIALRARVRLETPQTVALVATLAPKLAASGTDGGVPVLARVDAGPFVLKGRGPG